MTSQRIRTGWPIPYGTTGQSASVPPAASVSPARPDCQPGRWWASRRVGLSFTLPTQAPHNANRRAAKADPHGAAPSLHDRELTINAPAEIAGTSSKGAEHERCD
jgi:hypothetical protein